MAALAQFPGGTVTWCAASCSLRQAFPEVAEGVPVMGDVVEPAFHGPTQAALFVEKRQKPSAHLCSD